MTNFRKIVLSKRNHIDIHMINNLRQRDWLQKLHICNQNIFINEKDFDHSFIQNYKYTNSNYTESN